MTACAHNAALAKCSRQRRVTLPVSPAGSWDTIWDPFQLTAPALVQMKHSSGKTDSSNQRDAVCMVSASAPSSVCMPPLLVGVSIPAAQKSSLQRVHRRRANDAQLSYGRDLRLHQQRGGHRKPVVNTQWSFPQPNGDCRKAGATGRYHLKQIHSVSKRQISSFPHTGGF